MKAVKTNAAVTPAKSNVPFFSKEGSNGLFSKPAKENFFNRSSEHSPFIQKKLTVGEPNDKYEQEADSMANKVVQRLHDNKTEVTNRNVNAIQTKPSAPFATITPLIQAKCASCEQEEKLQKKEDEIKTPEEKIQRKPIFESNAPPDDKKNIQRKFVDCEEKEKLQKKEEGNSTGVIESLQMKSIFESRDRERVQRKCDDCEKEEKLQKKPGTSSKTVSPNIESSLSSSKNSGSSLPQNTREQMESSFGADFSGVRIHNNSSATQMSKDLNAQAFTHGSDIYFNSGKYDANSNEGKHLLAHELTHVVQQNNSSLLARKEEKPTETEGAKSEGNEQEASLLKIPGTKFAKTFTINPHLKKSYGPVEISPEFELKFEGVIEKGKSSTEVEYSSKGISIEQKVKESFGEIKLTGDIEHGKLSKIGIGLDIEIVEIKFVANADLEKPFQIVFEKGIYNKCFEFGDFTFKGEMKIAGVLNLTANKYWPGWINIAKAAAQRGVQTGRTITAVARGAFSAGEAGTASTFGVAATAAIAGAAYIGSVGFGLYKIGEALQEGRDEAVGRAFSNGYASALSQLISLRIEGYNEKSLKQALALGDWKKVFEVQRQRYQQPGPESANALPILEDAGRAAIIQDVDKYIKDNGFEKWKTICKNQQQKFGESDYERKNKYLTILYEQVAKGKGSQIGIPLNSETQ